MKTPHFPKKQTPQSFQTFPSFYPIALKFNKLTKINSSLPFTATDSVNVEVEKYLKTVIKNKRAMN
jgi:hypothetical protein